MSADNFQSPLPPPPTWDANSPGLVGMRAEKDTRVMVCHSWKWDFQEPGARLRPWLRELSFWRHDTSTPVHKHCVKLYKALPLGTIGRSLADQFSEDQICSGQGFDLIIGAIRHHFRSYLEAEPEVQAEVALYHDDEGSERDFRAIHVTNQQQTS